MWEKIRKFFKPKYGLLPLLEDARDLHFKELLFGEYERKHTEIELKPYWVENQFYLEVCSFEAWANALGVYFGEQISVRYLVAKAWQQGLCEKYGRASLRNGGKIAQKFGVVLEKDLPSDERMKWDDFVDVDFHNLDALASKRKIGSYYLIDTPSEYLQAIDQGYAVVLGRDWVNDFKDFRIGRKGYNIGGHATAGIGYKNSDVLALNSWGEDWQDKGRYLIDLKDFETDLKVYGAFAITNVPYTPKDILIKDKQSLLEKLQKLIISMKNSNRLYNVSLDFYQRGAILSPENKILGCGYSMTKVWNTAFPDKVVKLVGTNDWYEWMSKEKSLFEQVQDIENADIIVYPTKLRPQWSKLQHGHILHRGRKKNRKGSYWLLSNNSDTGKWDAYWDYLEAKKFYNKDGGIPEFLFKLK